MLLLDIYIVKHQIYLQKIFHTQINRTILKYYTLRGQDLNRP